MSIIEYTRCPKCGTLFDVSNIDFSDSKGWVQCGDCTHQFEAGKHAVNYSALLEQSILANMDEMKSSKREFTIGQLDVDMSVTEMSDLSISENIDLFGVPGYGGMQDPDSDYVETEFIETAFEPTLPNTEESFDDLEEVSNPTVVNNYNYQKEETAVERNLESRRIIEEFLANESKKPTEAKPAEAESTKEKLTKEKPFVFNEPPSPPRSIGSGIVSEKAIPSEPTTIVPEITVTEQPRSFEIDEIYADLDTTNVESIWSKILVASLAIPFLLMLLLSFVFQLQKREVVDWIPETYQEPLQKKWLSFLDNGSENEIDLSKIHLSSTRMEPHPEIVGATTIVLQLINRANINQSYPDFEISFTNDDGVIVARRVLKPFDYLDADQLNLLESKQAKTLRLNLAKMPEEADGYEIQVARGS